MDGKDFEIILQSRIAKTKAVLGSKEKEYSFGKDRLHNFKVAAAMGRTTSAKALWGMAIKHLVSVSDLVEGTLPVNSHYVDEKIGDMINYLILLEAVLLEPIMPLINCKTPEQIPPVADGWAQGHADKALGSVNQ